MYLNDRATFIGGLAMVLLALSTVAVVVLTATSMGEADPFNRSEVAEFLTDVNDNRTSVFATAAVGFINDGVIAMVVAAMFFLLFRDRSPVLATMAMVGVAAGATISLISDLNTVMLGIVARDFAEGSGTIPATDSSAFEVGRLLGMISMAIGLVMLTPIGLGLVSVGWLIARAPAGAVNPPRWLGWVAIVSGSTCWLAWLVVANEAFFVFFPINLLTTLVFLIGTGSWLITRRSEQPIAMAAAPSAA